ncbi:MAG: 2-succinyl-6-hydroxy-2,4-cyclohexadiene-carboxylate synthase [Candidatus Parcubacteria bacterium]|jgi:dipeptidyl aminopeptidase/acylaminoacyl peptidase
MEAPLPTQTEPPPQSPQAGPPVERTALVLEPEGLGPRKIAVFAVDALLVISAPILVTLLIGLLQTVRPEKLVSTRTPKDLGLAYEDVTLKTADGVSVAAWYVPAAVPTDAAVLVLHGYPADKGDILPRAAFLQKTYALLLIDFRSFGHSGGSFTTLGPKEVGDALAAVDELKRRGAKRIGVYGFSMGGTVALMTLTRSDAVDAAVSEAANADLRAVIEEPYRYMGPLKKVAASVTALVARLALGVDIDRQSPAATVAGTKKPVLVIHSKNDQVVPFAQAELLKDRLKGDPAAEFWFTEREGHGEPSADFAARVQDFFDRNLKPATP